MRVLSSAPRCVPGASALARRAGRVRRNHAHVCRAANDKGDVWGFLEGVKKARPLVACGVRSSERLAALAHARPSAWLAQKIEYEMNYENWAPRGALAGCKRSCHVDARRC